MKKTGQFLIKKSIDSKFYFVLIAGNGEVIATGESYLSVEGAEKGIKAVKKWSKKAKVIEGF